MDDYADNLTDTSAAFGQVAVGGSRTGNLEAIGDRDWFQVQLSAGWNYVINLQGQQSGAGTLDDPYLRVYNSSGSFLAENDDIVSATIRDSQLTLQATATGIYYIEAGAFDDGAGGTYRVSVSTAGPTDPSDDYADSSVDTAAPMGQVAVNGSRTGNLEAAGDRDWFRVQVTAGTSYVIKLLGQSGGGGSLEDPYLRIHDNSGVTIAENDDIVLHADRDSQLTFTASTTGTLYIEAGAFNDDYSGTYRISVTGIGDDYADDLLDTTAPVGQVAINGSSTGSLEAAGDHDWFQVQLTAGASYVISLQGQHAGGGTLEDPYLRLYNRAGTLLAENDDIAAGVNRDSQLAFTATTTGIYYLEAGSFNGSYTGTYEINISGNAVPAKMVANDFNGDFLGDILLQSSSGTVMMFQMGGNHILSSPTVAAPSADWHAAGVADFNGDGRADVFMQNNNGFVALWQMNGGQIEQNLAVANPGPQWDVVGTGDFNGDGKGDALLRHDSGFVSLWEMNGNQIIDNLGIANPGTQYHVGGTGDFDGDGHSDVLLRHDNGFIALWKFDGARISSNTAVANPGPQYHIAGTGDFDGDGRTDILMRHDNGFLALWQMNGDQIVSNQAVANPGPSYHVAAIADYNGDGHSDIIMEHTNGFLAVWEMTGAHIDANLAVTTIGHEWKIVPPSYELL